MVYPLMGDAAFDYQSGPTVATCLQFPLHRVKRTMAVYIHIIIIKRRLISRCNMPGDITRARKHITYIHTYIHNKSYSAQLYIKTERLCSTKVRPYMSNKLNKSNVKKRL